MLLDDDLPIPYDPDRRQSCGAQVYESLRTAILSAALPPGTLLSENRICRQIGVSRTPVREAMIRLAQDELIVVVPQQGSAVAPIRMTKVLEGHFLRHTLEIAILKRAMAVWTAEDSARTERNLTAQRSRAAALDFQGFHQLDEAFHADFARVAGVEGVSRIIVNANIHLSRVRQLANPEEGHMTAAIMQHQTVFDAIRSGRTTAAVAALETHIDSVFATMPRLFERHRSYFDDDPPVARP